MSSNQKLKTRLGDLLVERGLITQDQLLLAIQEQKSSQLQIGEILVKNGWISNRQIRKTLRVQSKLRNAILTSILSFSPLVLVGCGGGGGGQSQVNSDSAVASQQALAPNQDTLRQNSPDSSQSTETSSSFETLGSTQPTESPESAASSESAESSNNSQPSENSINADNGATIHLSWDYPLERVDGSDLEVYEIDSFRLYQLDENGGVGAMHVVDGLETQYDIEGLDDGEYHFAVTVVDIDGMESDYSEVLTVSVL
jgi:hypothetical protein